MDENEALDWGVGDQDDFDDVDENYQQPQNEPATTVDAEDNEDTISLGEDDDDQLLSYGKTTISTEKLAQQPPQEPENRHISPVPSEPMDVGANTDSSTRGSAGKGAADAFDSQNPRRKERRDSPSRRRGRREDRSPSTPQRSTNTRVTHALPPKPVGSVVPLPPPSRVLVAEPTTISPRAGGREPKKQIDAGKPHLGSPASPPNREGRTRSNNGEINHPSASKPTDTTWQLPDSLPPRTSRATYPENAQEKDGLQRSRSAGVGSTGLSFEDRHYRPSDPPPVNSSGRPSERIRPDLAFDRYPRSRPERADSPPRDRARPRSPIPVPDSRSQGYSDRLFVPSSYEPAPQDYRPDSRRKPAQRPDDYSDTMKSRSDIDRPTLRRRESSRGPRERNPPRQPDMREPPVSRLPRLRSPRHRDTNPHYEESSGNRERRAWPEEPVPSNNQSQSGRRSPFEQSRSKPVPSLGRHDEYYDRFQDHHRLDTPISYPQERGPMSDRRERPNDSEYSRYPRSQPPPIERPGRHLDNDRRSPPEERSQQPPPRAPLPPQNQTFNNRLPKKPSAGSTGNSWPSNRASPTPPESTRRQESSSNSHPPPIDTRMDLGARDGPPSSNRSVSKYQSSDDKHTGRRSRSPNDRYAKPLPPSGPSSMRNDLPPTGPRRREETRGVDQGRAPGRRQLEPQRRRDDHDLPPRDNGWARRDQPPHTNLPPSGPKKLLNANAIPINPNARRQPPSAPGQNSSASVAAVEPPPPQAPVQVPPAAQAPPPFLIALPPASALMDPSKGSKLPEGGGHQRTEENNLLDTTQAREPMDPSPNFSTRPTEPRAHRRTRFDQPTKPPQADDLHESAESQETYQMATPPPISREPSISMKSKTSSEHLSDDVERNLPLEERIEMQAPQNSLPLISRFSDGKSQPVERADGDGRRTRFGESAQPPPPPPAAPSTTRGARDLSLPPRPQLSPDILPRQPHRSTNGRTDDHRYRDVPMDTLRDEPPQFEGRSSQAQPLKGSLLERISSADNLHESQSLRERIVPSKRDREEMSGRDRRPDARDEQYEIDDGIDPKRQRRRGGAGRPRRSNTGGGRR